MEIIRKVLMAVAVTTALCGLFACGQGSSSSPAAMNNGAVATVATTTIDASQ
ncbi:MAG TPA: hypothetical protein VLY45_06525 [Nitrospiria bacterium]|nr:hypothetical protein [Nitrospiria bacterium]